MALLVFPIAMLVVGHVGILQTTRKRFLPTIYTCCCRMPEDKRLSLRKQHSTMAPCHGRSWSLQNCSFIEQTGRTNYYFNSYLKSRKVAMSNLPNLVFLGPIFNRKPRFLPLIYKNVPLQRCNMSKK